MKKLLFVLALFMIVCGPVLKPAMADDLSIGDAIKKLPGLQQGIAYSFLDGEISYLTTIECFNWKGLAIEAGYSSTDKVVAVISYELVNLQEKGVETPILNLIDARIGAYGGYGRLGFFDNNNDQIDSVGNNEWDAGLSLTIITVRF